MNEYFFMNNGEIQLGSQKKKKTKPIKKGNISIYEPKPRTCRFSYSCPESQGALANETNCFPNQYNPKTHIISSAYSDRMHSWDRKNYDKVCKLFGTGDQGWAQMSQSMTDESLLEVAQVALKLPCKPIHARVVHHYNASSGYSCPTIEAIYEIGDEDERRG